jgi:phosphohistidine phosphatase
MDPAGRLIVMRHGKAGELPGGPDFERALRRRGRSDSAAAGEWLRARGYQPDEVLCSAARRARQTWQYVGEALGGDPVVRTEERLYHAGAGQLLEIIRATADGVTTLMYVGHNPAAVELIAELTGAEPQFPPAAIAVIAIAGIAGSTGGWAGLVPGDNGLEATWTPEGGEVAG